MNIDQTLVKTNRSGLVSTLGMILQGTAAMSVLDKIIREEYNPIESVKQDAEMSKLVKRYADNLENTLTQELSVEEKEQLERVIHLSNSLLSELTTLLRY